MGRTAAGAVALLSGVAVAWVVDRTGVNGRENTIEVALALGATALLSFPLILFTIRTLVPSSPRGQALRYSVGTWAISVVALAAGLSATTICAWLSQLELQGRMRTHFEQLTERIVRETQRRVGQPRYGLAGLRGVYAASDHVTRDEVARYVASRSLESEFPGAIGIGFIEPVARSELDAFTARERADGEPDFRIWSLARPGSPLENAPDLYVIKHCFPREQNAAAWGLDIGSEPVRREAALRAIRTGAPAISGRIRLAQDRESRTGLLFFLPVFRNGPSPATADERRAALIGLAYAPIVLDVALADVANAAEGELDFEVFDGEETDKSTQLFDHDHHLDHTLGDVNESQYLTRTFRVETPITVGGRTWTLVTSTTPRFDARFDRSPPTLIRVGGGLISFLGAAFIFALLTSRARAIGIAQQMTVDLRLAKTQAEDALREVDAFRATLDEHSIVSVADRSGKIIDLNSEFCRISGYSRDELLGQDHRILNSGVHPKEFWVAAWKTLAAGRPWRGDVCNRAKDGTHYWVDSIIAPFVDARGRIEKYISIRTDITSRKTVEAQLILASKRADAANASKSTFLANMTHEIRTPLTAILGFADVLRESEVRSDADPLRIQAVNTIHDAGHHLLAILNDILDLSKIEADRMVVERVETPLIGVLREVTDFTRHRAVAKGLVLRIDLATPVPDRIVSDPTRLRQILLNLLGNAVKFTDSGRVAMIVRADETVQGPRLTIDVDDTGAGMAPEQAARLFQPFSQADETITRKHGGTGLGLAICRRLAELMGGGVSLVHSQPDRGSCFRLELPLEATPDTEVVSHFEPAPANRNRRPTGTTPIVRGRILLAEDGPDNQRLIALLLRKAGATVEVAANGRIALDLIAQSRQLGTPFDLLLTDLQMPELDGFALMNALREEKSRLPIVALTAHAHNEDRERCAALGCVDFVPKPIDSSKLLHTCAKWTNASRADLALDSA